MQHFCSFVDYGPEDNCYIEANNKNACEALIKHYWAAKDVEREGYWKKKAVCGKKKKFLIAWVAGFLGVPE